MASGGVQEACLPKLWERRLSRALLATAAQRLRRCAPPPSKNPGQRSATLGASSKNHSGPWALGARASRNGSQPAAASRRHKAPVPAHET